MIVMIWIYWHLIRELLGTIELKEEADVAAEG
jgi:hypothetical protein